MNEAENPLKLQQLFSRNGAGPRSWFSYRPVHSNTSIIEHHSLGNK